MTFHHASFATEIAAPTKEGAATRIKLIPAGQFKARDGRGPFDAGDRASMDAILTATKAYHGRTDLMIDYDHQSVFAAIPGVGGKAPAAGWLAGLEVADDGIYATVRWTPAALVALSNSEYRYISPYFRHDKTGKVMLLVNAALTNMPALDMEAIAASAQNASPHNTSNIQKDIGMDKILAALGLGADAKEDAALTAIAALQSGGAALAAINAKAKESKIGDSVAAICAALSASGVEPDPAKFVPMAMYAELATKVAKIETDGADKLAADAVALAVSGGKVTPGQKDWAMSYAKSDLAGFTAFVAAAPQLMKPQVFAGEAMRASTGGQSVAEINAKAAKYQKDQKEAGIDVGWGDAVMAVSA